MNDLIEKFKTGFYFKRHVQGKRGVINPEKHWKIIIIIAFFAGILFLAGSVIFYMKVSKDVFEAEGGSGGLFLNRSELFEAVRFLEQEQVKFEDLKRNPENLSDPS